MNDRTSSRISVAFRYPTVPPQRDPPHDATASQCCPNDVPMLSQYCLKAVPMLSQMLSQCSSFKTFPASLVPHTAHPLDPPPLALMYPPPMLQVPRRELFVPRRELFVSEGCSLSCGKCATPLPAVLCLIVYLPTRSKG